MPDGPAGERRDRLSARIRALREAVSDADEAAERVRVIVRDLRVFSRSEEDRREPVDVQRVLESSLRMARNELRQRARVVRRFDPVPAVDGNEPRLGQVFLNLLVNAAQAIPEGQVERNEITVSTRLERGQVVVEVADTGEGIPPEVLPRIFDAFFTTKPIGVGTGLGLTICHRILASMNGGIEVESEVGRGTRFRVTLALANLEEEEEVTAAPPAPGKDRRASVLIIEDEAPLGRLLERVLAPHKVVVMTRAREALARIETREHFDIILCDLMMPEMTGMDFYQRLIGLRPEVAARVVFMTGGAFTAGAREFLERVPNLRLDKPINTALLRHIVDRSLPA
jgi:CheY-like chemotaxis protein/two-component sensor histidine kinase